MSIPESYDEMQRAIYHHARMSLILELMLKYQSLDRAGTRITTFDVVLVLAQLANREKEAHPYPIIEDPCSSS